MTGVKSNVRKELTYYSQFNSNSNKIWLLILKNLTITSGRKSWFHPWKIEKAISSIMMTSHHIVWLTPSLAAPLEPLAYRENVSGFSPFYRYYFGRCSSVLDELVPLPPSCGRSTRYSNRLDDFSVAISGSYKNIIKWDKGDNVNSLFPCTPRL